MHESVKVERKTLDELLLIRDDYKVLKEEIEKLYNVLNGLELCREHDLSIDDIEEI